MDKQLSTITDMSQSAANILGSYLTSIMGLYKDYGRYAKKGLEITKTAGRIGKTTSYQPTFEYAKAVLENFKKVVEQVSNLHRKYDLEICALQTQKKFVENFALLLSYYNKDHKLQTAVKELLFPYWYKEQITYYIAYANALLFIMYMEIKEIQITLDKIKTIDDDNKKQMLFKQLKESLSCNI